jgi:hypothetical protein
VAPLVGSSTIRAAKGRATKEKESKNRVCSNQGSHWKEEEDNKMEGVELERDLGREKVEIGITDGTYSD